MQAHTAQRNPTYFPEPERFEPSRWISNGAINSGSPEVRDMMLVWGKGSRICLGQHMAVMELKILLARIIDTFDVRLRGYQTHAEMEMTDHFTLIPKGKKCGLVFTMAEGAD
jgi:cytochrome P450